MSKMQITSTFILLLLLAVANYSQTVISGKADDILKNVKIDVSSPEDVIKELGKPDGDGMDEFDAELFDSWMKIKKNAKVFRKLTYKKIGETDEVLFRFYDNKLVKISFVYKKNKNKRVLAASLPKKYNADFIILRSSLKDTKISDYEGQKENTIPQVYQSFYSLISIQPNVVYYSIVMNPGFKTFMKSLKGEPSKEMFPGYLANFIIISRTLINNK